MKLRGVFLFVMALSSVIIVGMVFYVSENVHNINKFIQRVGVKFYTNRNLELREYAAQRSTEITRVKPFIYLTETERCLPPNLATSSQIGDAKTCDCDVIVLSFRSKCRRNDNQSHISYLFNPNTGWASGRNVLFFEAMDRRPGYHYYIFINDDTKLRYNKFTPADMRTKMSPFRAVEKWLLDYEPAVGVLHYLYHNGADVVQKRRKELCGINETSLVLPTVFFDAVFNAFHHKAIEHILPYPTQYEHQNWLDINIHTVTTVEVKFPGQALLFAPVTAGNPIHRPYQRNQTDSKKIRHEYIEQIIEEAPPELRKHEVFEELRKHELGLKRYLTTLSRTFCLNVTRHQPVIPYRHILNTLQ
ncbi:uncharacterized protein LOC144649438 [Oculina patagonica]